MGLLVDADGNDTHTAHGFAVGFGGPMGVGAVLDLVGDDSYQCGRHYPSGYNAGDLPNAKPGDPGFQWDAFGLGCGAGRRIYPFSAEADAFCLAGGLGVLVDMAGNDKYEGSNFSLACGYFFGAGIVLDFSGDDRYQAARYGLAAGAHCGQGLFIDYAGNDKYTSTGPTYTCGCAWDKSAFLLVDAAGDDEYALERSHGLGRADHGSWGVFADLAGKDRYAGSGLGPADKDSVAVFFDKAGEDDYGRVSAPKDAAPGNRKTFKLPAEGGLFVDR